MPEEKEKSSRRGRGIFKLYVEKECAPFKIAVSMLWKTWEEFNSNGEWKKQQTKRSHRLEEAGVTEA
eukprot:2349879-Pyramimonas_sp.AAC.1